MMLAQHRRIAYRVIIENDLFIASEDIDHIIDQLKEIADSND